jgi:sec-independent protein translocase protein TatB
VFDISFTELMFVGVVALIVIGPERLPKVAKTVGHLFGRAQRYVNDVKSDIQREVELDELRKMKDEMESAARSIQTSMEQTQNSIRDEFESPLDGLKSEFDDVQKGLEQSTAPLEKALGHEQEDPAPTIAPPAPANQTESSSEPKP